MRAIFVSVLLVALITGVVLKLGRAPAGTGAPPGGVSEESAPSTLDRLAYLRNWRRPDGPARVGLQVGHWKNSEFPDELAKLRGNSGATAGGFAEWEVNLEVARLIAAILEEEGAVVDILPATIPPGYWADLFVAIHADGSHDTSKSGFKIASPWRDFTGDSDEVVEDLRARYAAATGLEWDGNITRNMRGYYAFSWWRYEHAIHPMSTALIFEMGFLSNPQDRRLMTSSPEIPAGAIATGILGYLEDEGLL